MAAVFALIFLFVLASVAGFLSASSHSLSFATMLAMGCFAMLAAGVFYGVLRMSKTWDSSDQHR